MGSSDFARLMEEKTKLEMANIRLKAKLARVEKVRDELATQCLNNHAVKMLDKALGEKPPGFTNTTTS